jgi:2-keto-4-pentenoate hydratase/2-oxohepta-3-ene-1,7-dioic acid hydratase in catechol pathway
MTFSLATIRRANAPVPVMEIAGRYWSLTEVAPELLQSNPRRGLMNIFENWPEAEGKLMALAKDPDPSRALDPAPAEDDFLTPLQYPAKVVLGGANYYDHMRKDAGITNFTKENAVPVFFLKAPTTTLVGCGKTVRYPTQSQKLDWEVELAAVIGKKIRRVSEAEAAGAVAGYTIGIDLSARDWQFHPKHPFKFDLFGGKSFDDSCPLGPRIVPAQFLDAGNLQLRLSVNGRIKQNANTREMIWYVAEQISLISEHLTLEPGDVLLTGTPAGVGLATGTYLKVGDRVEAEIDGLGRLSVEIVPDR